MSPILKTDWQTDYN